MTGQAYTTVNYRQISLGRWNSPESYARYNAIVAEFHAKYAKKFGDRLKRLRGTADLSQDELAAKAHIHRTQMSLLERGRRFPQLGTLIRLARALEVQPSKLLPDLDD